MVGLAVTSMVALGALRANALSQSGEIAALFAGAIAVTAGWPFAILLFSFFISASSLSRFRERIKAARISGVVKKGGRRDAWQVMANGGVFALAALVTVILPGSIPAFAAIGALAAASADTWATEIGVLSQSQPRSILDGQLVPPGTSGGITAQGMAATVAGAAFIGIIALLTGFDSRIFPAAIVAGVGGALLDSILGASIQVRRWCERCSALTERSIHSCGAPARRVSGWLSNDAVNLACTLAGAAIGALWVL